MARPLFVLLAGSVLLTGWAVSTAAQESDFLRKAERLLHRDYSFHAWREAEQTVDGDDWSLPDWVRAARYSGISINAKKVPADFPGRIQHTVRVSWREIEPREGEYDFSVLRQRILAASENGKFAVKMGLGASVWETRYFRSVEDRTIVRTTPGTAPEWLARRGIPRIEERPNSSLPFQVVNLDIYHPEYHTRYLRMVRELGKTGVPQMEELDLCYLHLKSASRGEEGSGPNPDDSNRRLYEERLAAWAEAFDGVEYKLCNVSHREEDMELALRLGMGQRNGFVEHYMMHAPNPGLGQLLDEEGCLVVDEQMFEYHKEHLYDHTARKTSVDSGQDAIQFAVDERFLSGGPHRVAVKITYLDGEHAQWNLEYYTSPDDVAARTVQCGNSGEAKTVTFLLDDAFFPGRGTHGRDLLIRATQGNAVIRFLRVVKRTPVETLD